jgi:hypothetical protein
LLPTNRKPIASLTVHTTSALPIANSIKFKFFVKRTFLKISSDTFVYSHSLSKEAVRNKELYVKNTAGILAEKGLFLITSCNWTKVLIHH